MTPKIIARDCPFLYSLPNHSVPDFTSVNASEVNGITLSYHSESDFTLMTNSDETNNGQAFIKPLLRTRTMDTAQRQISFHCKGLWLNLLHGSRASI